MDFLISFIQKFEQLKKLNLDAQQLYTIVEKRCNEIGISTNVYQEYFEANEEEAFQLYHSMLTSRTAWNDYRTSAIRHRFITEHLPSMIWDANAKGEIVYINKYGVELLNPQKNEANFYDLSTIRHPDDVEWVKHETKKALDNLTTFRGEIRYYVPSSKRYEWFWVQASPVKSPNPDNEITWHGVSVNIHERKQTLEALKNEQAKNTLLMDNLPGVIYKASSKKGWPLNFISEGVQQLFGRSPSDFLSGKTSFDEFIYPEVDKKSWADIKERLRNKEDFEITYRIKVNDEIKWVWEQGKPLINNQGEEVIEGLIMDVTQRIKMQEEIESISKFNQDMLMAMPGILIILDIETFSLEYTNERFEELSTYTRDEINAHKHGLIDVVHPDDVKIVRNAMDSLNTQHDDFVVNIEVRAVTKERTHKWYGISGKSFVKENGSVKKIIAVAEDITQRKEAEHKYINSQRNIQALLDGTLHSFYLLDKDLKVLSLNAYAKNESKNILGIEITSGFDFNKLIPKDLRERFMYSFNKALKGEIVDHINDYANGEIIGRYRVTYNPVIEADGTVSAVVFSSLDLSEVLKAQQKLKERETLLNSINKNIQEGIFRIIPEEGIVYINDAFAQMFGYENSEEFMLYGKRHLSYKHKEKYQFFVERLLKDKVVTNIETELVNKNGNSFWGLISCVLEQDEKGNSYFDGAVRDVTDLKNIREELIKAKNAAEEMNKLKSSFLANMSHEIRTPINGILGLAQIMEDEPDLAEMKNYVQLLKISGERLLDTITSILDLSRLEANKPELALKGINLNELLLDTQRIFEILAHKKGITLEYHLNTTDIAILADENIFLQTMNNLLGNAIKFTKKGGVDVFTQTITIKKKKFVQIDVKDTGIGISEEFLPKVFLPFHQESTGQSRAFEGSGLGLSIAKKYVELLGGKLNVISKLHKGSTFTLILPIYEE